MQGNCFVLSWLAPSCRYSFVVAVVSPMPVPGREKARSLFSEGDSLQQGAASELVYHSIRLIRPRGMQTWLLNLLRGVVCLINRI
jgi:hypothetical protein